jgi:hypothetical protein
MLLFRAIPTISTIAAVSIILHCQTAFHSHSSFMICSRNLTSKDMKPSSLGCPKGAARSKSTTNENSRKHWCGDISSKLTTNLSSVNVSTARNGCERLPRNLSALTQELFVVHKIFCSEQLGLWTHPMWTRKRRLSPSQLCPRGSAPVPTRQASYLSKRAAQEAQ